MNIRVRRPCETSVLDARMRRPCEASVWDVRLRRPSSRTLGPGWEETPRRAKKRRRESCSQGKDMVPPRPSAKLIGSIYFESILKVLCNEPDLKHPSVTDSFSSSLFTFILCVSCLCFIFAASTL